MNQDPARHPACTIIFDRPTGLQIAPYIDVEPGTRRILRCSPRMAGNGATLSPSGVLANVESTQLSRSRRGLRTAGVGHEPKPLSARAGVRNGSNLSVPARGREGLNRRLRASRAHEPIGRMQTRKPAFG